MIALKFLGSAIVFSFAALFYGMAIVLMVIGSILAGIAGWGAK